MKLFIFTCLALLTISGCGATYTTIDKSGMEPTASASDADCPNGIDYKTGRCR